VTSGVNGEPIDVWAIARAACTPKQLQVLELREKHGRSDYAIAYMLGLDRSTVRGHLRAAERNVRHALEGRPRAGEVVSR
jgi:DNA-binding NarL/FixJ family response regulator